MQLSVMLAGALVHRCLFSPPPSTMRQLLPEPAQDLVQLRTGPVEAVISLSIMYVAVEIVHAQRGNPGMALFLFNIGIEIGQLLFIFLLLALL